MLVLDEKLADSFAKGVIALFAEEMHTAGLGHASCKQRLGLGELSGTSALADSLAIHDLVDVPDSTPEEESRRSSRGRRHRDGLESRLVGMRRSHAWASD